MVSQFAPLKPMFKSQFHARNWLIAAMSEKVFVAQASIKSGSMLTAKFAIELGRPVATLPFFLLNPEGVGH